MNKKRRNDCVQACIFIDEGSSLYFRNEIRKNSDMLTAKGISASIIFGNQRRKRMPLT
jgi:hypothetical protein